MIKNYCVPLIINKRRKKQFEDIPNIIIFLGNAYITMFDMHRTQCDVVVVVDQRLRLLASLAFCNNFAPPERWERALLRIRIQSDSIEESLTTLHWFRCGFILCCYKTRRSFFHGNKWIFLLFSFLCFVSLLSLYRSSIRFTEILNTSHC